MVVFTSGIVDEGPLSWSLSSSVQPPVQFRLVVGVEPGGWGWGGGGLAHCWALRDQPVGWLLGASLGCCSVECGAVVVGGFVV